MAWCPKCKNEYRPGFTVCADCGCELVEELSEKQKDVAYFGTEQEIQNIISFMEDNDFSDLECHYDEEEDQYELLVENKEDDDFKRAMAVYFSKILPELKRQMASQNFYFISEQNEDADDKPVHLMTPVDKYEKPEERAVEYKSGAATLLLVGCAGMIALVLADFGIINFPMYGSGKILINVVMGGMFLAFIVLGISSIGTYKKLKLQAKSDSTVEEDILKHFDENVTLDMLKSKDVQGEKEEVLYFNRIKLITELVLNSFPDLDDAFVEYISEIIYSKYFE